MAVACAALPRSSSLVEQRVEVAKGEGVTQDYVLAHMWFNLAVANVNENALGNRDRAASKMTSAQIAEAQKLAREWKPKK